MRGVAEERHIAGCCGGETCCRVLQRGNMLQRRHGSAGESASRQSRRIWTARSSELTGCAQTQVLFVAGFWRCRGRLCNSGRLGRRPGSSSRAKQRVVLVVLVCGPVQNMNPRLQVWARSYPDGSTNGRNTNRRAPDPKNPPQGLAETTPHERPCDHRQTTPTLTTYPSSL